MNGDGTILEDSPAPGVARLTLARPHKRNAFTPVMIDAFTTALERIECDPQVRVLVVNGSAGAFSAGADLSYFAGDAETATDFVRRGAEAMATLSRMPKPSIACVNGFAFGGGCELALACTFRVASESAVFALPEASLGLIPAWGGVPNLVRHLGRSRAILHALTGDRLTAATAMQYGLVQDLCGETELDAVAIDLATRLAKLSPTAVRHIINLASFSGADPAWETAAFADVQKEPAARQTINGFLARRKAA